MSLLWHNVWLLQYLPSSTKLNYMESVEIGMIGKSIAYWMRFSIRTKFSPSWVIISVTIMTCYVKSDMQCTVRKYNVPLLLSHEEGEPWSSRRFRYCFGGFPPGPLPLLSLRKRFIKEATKRGMMRNISLSILD